MPTFPATTSHKFDPSQWGSTASQIPDYPPTRTSRVEDHTSSTVAARGRGSSMTAELVDRIAPHTTSARGQYQQSSPSQQTIPMPDSGQILPSPDFPYPTGSRPLSHDLVSRLNPISPQPDSSTSFKDLGGGRTDSKIADDAIYLGLVSLAEAEFLFRKSVGTVYLLACLASRRSRFYAERFLESFMEKLSPLIGLFDPDCKWQSIWVSSSIGWLY